MENLTFISESTSAPRALCCIKRCSWISVAVFKFSSLVVSGACFQVRNLKNMGFRIPLKVVNAAHQANQIYPFAISLLESTRVSGQSCYLLVRYELFLCFRRTNRLMSDFLRRLASTLLSPATRRIYSSRLLMDISWTGSRIRLTRMLPNSPTRLTTTR